MNKFKKNLLITVICTAVCSATLQANPDRFFTRIKNSVNSYLKNLKENQVRNQRIQHEKRGIINNSYRYLEQQISEEIKKIDIKQKDVLTYNAKLICIKTKAEIERLIENLCNEITEITQKKRMRITRNIMAIVRTKIEDQWMVLRFSINNDPLSPEKKKKLKSAKKLYHTIYKMFLKKENPITHAEKPDCYVQKLSLQ